MLDIFRSLFAPPRDLILLVLAAWLGLTLADRRARRSTIGEKDFDTLVIAMLVAFLLGGRLLFLVAHPQAFAASPLSFFSPNRDLFDLWGAVAAALVVGAAVMQRKSMPVWAGLDLLAPLFAALGAGLALSHLASGAAFGRETHVPWAVYLWGAWRHPTQLYGLLAAAFIFGAIWFAPIPGRAGRRFLLWLALTAASRLAIEGFRGDSTLVFGGIRLAQLVSWLVLAVAFVLLEWRGVAPETPQSEQVA